MHFRRGWLVALVAVVALAAVSVQAQSLWRSDGSVVIAGVWYPSYQEFVRSDAFREGGYRCGVRPPLATADFGAGDCSLSNTNPTADYDPGDTFQIPVVVHIIHKVDGTGNISDAMVTSQIEILNEDFQALAGTNGANGTAGGISFVLATSDPSDNPTTGITRTANDTWFQDNDEAGFKAALAWDTTKYLNIYTNTAGGLLGYAYYPQSDAGMTHDGVVINYQAFGRNSPLSPFDQGRTATHEVGHYLGLEHTFHPDGSCPSASAPSCYGDGDLICDTNPEESAAAGCPMNPSSCSTSDPVDNYMDYSNDLCMTKFTTEQVRRMRCSMVHYRGSLYTAIPADQVFDDVPPSHPFYAYINRFSEMGITSGCSTEPPLYCPNANVKRYQMATFIVRALEETQDNSPGSPFDDVPESHQFYGYIKRFSQLGITSGCNLSPPLFCPDAFVNRGQMAVFMVRALGETPDNSPGSPFDDVPESHPYYGYIKRFSQLGITSGCNASPPLYCPQNLVTRGQMAVFMVRAFDPGFDPNNFADVPEAWVDPLVELLPLDPTFYEAVDASVGADPGWPVVSPPSSRRLRATSP